MHRRCITLISSLLTPSGWVRKPLNYLKVRTGMYRYILLRTNMEFLYCPVPSRTGTYWYVPVRTILPNPVQGYRIPDALPVACLADSIVNDMYIPCMYTFLPGGQDSRCVVRIPDAQVTGPGGGRCKASQTLRRSYGRPTELLPSHCDLPEVEARRSTGR